MLIFVLCFVLLTVLCWGNYGPLMHEGQLGMNGSYLKPFIGVGFAYFLIAVVVPAIKLKRQGEKGHWTIGGSTLSVFAGTVGALGALGVIMAFAFGGNPVYVMPLVFGGAPVVNTLVTMTMTNTFRQVNVIFLVGIIAAAGGAAGVLWFKPRSESQAAAVPEAAEVEEETAAVVEPEPAEIEAANRYPMGYVYATVGLAIVCWGSYGPFLHKGQSKMGGSRMRPFLCVGLAYFGIAVIVPLLLLTIVPDEGNWTVNGTLWSLAGGAAGAVGALGIILAFNFGGKPIYVMPLVFGFAPVMNTITTTTLTGAWEGVIGNYGFFISLILVIAGAVTVLIFAPRPRPKPQPA